MKMKFVKAFLVLCLMSSAPTALADYFLKFTASGGSHDTTTPMANSLEAWLEISIVDAYPLDGPVHFPNSETGSFTLHHDAWAKKIEGVDNLSFYYAEVPRSVILYNKSSGGKVTLSFGDAPKKYLNAPSFFLPDGLLVAPGLSTDYVNSIYRFFVAAAMPMKTVPANHTVSPAVFPNTQISAPHNYCPQGWSQSVIDGNAVELWQSVKRTGHNHCDSRAMYSGYITFAVRLK